MVDTREQAFRIALNEGNKDFARSTEAIGETKIKTSPREIKNSNDGKLNLEYI